MNHTKQRGSRWHGLMAALAVLLCSEAAVTRAGAQSPMLENEDLLERVRAEGTLGVVVRLTADFTPEGTLAAPGVVSQRQGIRQFQDRVLRALSGQHISSLTQFRTVPYLAMVVDEPALRVLLAHPAVVRVREDVAMELNLAESIPLIGADTAHASGFSGQGQTIAVLDTGVDGSHPFLTNKVVDEACFSSNGPNQLSLCPNGQEVDFSVGAGAHCTVNEDCWHGTHVAGIAVGNNGPGFTGVAKNASIIAIQVASVPALNGQPIFDTRLRILSSDVMQALEYVLSLQGTFNIASVNMSFGISWFSPAPCDQSDLKPAIDNLRSVGIVSIAGTGNNGSPGSPSLSAWAPSCISSAVSVGATTDADEVAFFSNSPNFLDLLAPGVSITSSMPPGSGFACGNGNLFEACDGTSMATPHVSGAWAVYRQKFPQATVDQVLAAFVNTGLPVLYPHGQVETKPRIRLDVALDPCTPPPSGDWILDFSCTFQGFASAPANVVVENNATLTIDSGAFLDIDLLQSHLLVRQGSRVIVKAGGKID